MLHIPLKDYFRETRIFNSRLIIGAVAALALVFLLLLRLMWLQIIAHRHYETLSQANRVRPIPIQPPRGLILDRNGVVLVQNLPVYTLEIVPEQVDNMDRTIAELSKLVRITDSDLKQFRRQLRERPRFEGLTLRTHLTDEEAARIAVRRPYLNGVDLQARLQRYYPLGGLGVHAIGYVGRISDEDLENLDKAEYRGMNYIGKLGLEAEYESELLGRVGYEKVETNAHGRALRTLDRIAPVAGKNLILNLDIRLQELVEQAFGKNRGALVAIQPTTGAVLAFVSMPTYDPNPFVNGIDPDSYKALLDNPDKPLINRALNGKYSPGSTIKAFLGLAAMEQPGYDPNHTIFCPGYYALPGSKHLFRDWKKGGHGAVTLHDAIVQSCDVYFYRLAVSMDIEAIKNFLASFGFGSPTGIDLPDESAGLLPSPEWKAAHGQPWYPGDTVITGIGQGQLLVTPLQLANGIATIADRGTRMKPHLLEAFQDARTKALTEIKPEIEGQITLKNPEHWDELIKDLTDVTATPKGTAYGIGWNAPYKIAGKTGTAQVKAVAQGESYVASMVPERLRDHALFIAMAPADHPEVAVSIIVENGGHGGSVAAPIARKVMDYVILGKEGGKAPAAPAAPKPENNE
jgi:penicillin-binding protein 2